MPQSDSSPEASAAHGQARCLNAALKAPPAMSVSLDCIIDTQGHQQSITTAANIQHGLCLHTLTAGGTYSPPGSTTDAQQLCQVQTRRTGHSYHHPTSILHAQGVHGTQALALKHTMHCCCITPVCDEQEHNRRSCIACPNPHSTACLWSATHVKSVDDKGTMWQAKSSSLCAVQVDVLTWEAAWGLNAQARSSSAPAAATACCCHGHKAASITQSQGHCSCCPALRLTHALVL